MNWVNSRDLGLLLGGWGGGDASWVLLGYEASQSYTQRRRHFLFTFWVGGETVAAWPLISLYILMRPD